VTFRSSPGKKKSGFSIILIEKKEAGYPAKLAAGHQLLETFKSHSFAVYAQSFSKGILSARVFRKTRVLSGRISLSRFEENLKPTKKYERIPAGNVYTHYTHHDHCDISGKPREDLPRGGEGRGKPPGKFLVTLSYR